MVRHHWLKCMASNRSCTTNLTEVLGSLLVAKGGRSDDLAGEGENFDVKQTFVVRAAPVTPCRDLRANRPCRDGVAKRERRGNGGNGLRALAHALNGEVAVVHKAAKNALVDVDALDFVEVISKVRRLMQPVLWTTRMLGTSVSVVQRWNQAVAVQYKAQAQRPPPMSRKPTSARRPRPSATAPEMRPPPSTPRLPEERTSSARWWNTVPFRRAARFRRYNVPYAYPKLTHHHCNLGHLEPINEAVGSASSRAAPN